MPNRFMQNVGKTGSLPCPFNIEGVGFASKIICCRTCSLRFENYFLIIERVRFASKIIFFLCMCSLRFENNFLTIGHVRFHFENSCPAIECVRFASKIIFVLSNVFTSFRK
jgi:hypothetical protein